MSNLGDLISASQAVKDAKAAKEIKQAQDESDEAFELRKKRALASQKKEGARAKRLLGYEDPGTSSDGNYASED